MKFFDEVKINVSSWTGGDGVITWRREKHVPFWWPSGWDGGKWWSIIVRGSSNERTLMSYRYNVIYQAKDGEPGQWQQKYGKNAEDIILLVPLWTLIKNAEDETLIAHITEHDQEIILAAWWRWWLWNMHFTSSTNQFPHICLLGEPWNSLKVIFELQMLADVALVWTPSVWKSSLINIMSNVKAKTAEYHFTTLVPNLGIITHKGSSFSMIDIPGLITWAHTWKGLGNAFLRHILKSRVIVFVLDAHRYESWREEFGLIFDELLNYIKTYISQWEENERSHSITLTCDASQCSLLVHDTTPGASEDPIIQKSICWALNKSDLIADDEIIEELLEWRVNSAKQQIADRGFEISSELVRTYTHVLSAATWSWKNEFLDALMPLISVIKTGITYESHEIDDTVVKTIVDITEHDRWFLIQEWYIWEEWSQKVKVWEIDHPEVAYLSFVIPRWKDEAEMRFRRQLEQKWLLHRFDQFGAKNGDILKIVSPYAWVEDRYIMRE